MILLDGKKTANDIKEEIAVEVATLVNAGGKKPHLAAILIGSDGASETYVNAKVKACEKVGFDSTLVRFDSDVTEEELLAEIEKINRNMAIDGLIVQLPLPKHIDEMKVTEAILPEKDVDGFHPENIGRMVLNLPTYLPATPAGILELLARYEIETLGKHCVVIGRSHIVGSPMSILMARNNNPELAKAKELNIPIYSYPSIDNSTFSSNNIFPSLSCSTISCLVGSKICIMSFS